MLLILCIVLGLYVLSQVEGEIRKKPKYRRIDWLSMFGNVEKIFNDNLFGAEEYIEKLREEIQSRHYTRQNHHDDMVDAMSQAIMYGTSWKEAHITEEE